MNKNRIISCTIAIVNDDNTITSIFCKYDGTPEQAGETLKKYYSKKEDVQALISKGDLLDLGDTIGESHFNNTPPKNHKNLSQLQIAISDEKYYSDFWRSLDYMYVYTDGKGWECQETVYDDECVRQYVREWLTSLDAHIDNWDMPIQALTFNMLFAPELNVYSYLVGKLSERYPGAYVYEEIYLELEITKRTRLADKKDKKENNLDDVWSPIVNRAEWSAYLKRKYIRNKKIKEDVKNNREKIIKIMEGK